MLFGVFSLNICAQRENTQNFLPGHQKIRFNYVFFSYIISLDSHLNQFKLKIFAYTIWQTNRQNFLEVPVF